ncbi:MAG TPA: hypothetical protein VND19_14305 [Acetobacteraceae bacterium]|nr:hypothetical protein [Acetobacteraceae bacterium]
MSRLEGKARDVRQILGRLEPLIAGIHAQMPHLATKAEVERSRGDIMTALETKPNRGAMWSMAIALFTLVMAAMAAAAIYLPLASRMLPTSR